MLEETLETVRFLWRRTLHVEEVRSEDNFFALGGDSMLAGMMLIALAEALGVEASPGSLYEHPTLAGFSRVVEAMKQNGEGR